MKRFVEGEDQLMWEENPVRAIDAFVDALDVGALARVTRRRRSAAPSRVN